MTVQPGGRSPVRPDPAELGRAERAVGAVVRFGARVPGLRRFLLWPVVARPGYWFATACAWTWGRLLFGRYASGHGIHYFSQLPAWAYGRGGTTIGAIYLTIVCVLPEYMIAQTGIPLFLGGTSLLIVVNVTVDTITQIQSHLLAHQYGDLIKKAKLKGRLR